MAGGNINDWKKAGFIAGNALKYGSTLIRRGAKAVDVLDRIEEKIKEMGATPAFPAQLSCNHIAAHWCADPNDSLVLYDQIVCLDVGVHVNGCIGDCALTVDLSGKYSKLVEASQMALNNAIRIIKPGITVAEIGREIKKTILSYGFVPIHNPSGHGLDVYSFHSEPVIPNYDTHDDTQLEKGQIIAIEPSATNGAGMIYETDNSNIFSLVQKRPVRSTYAREILAEIEKYNNLPFTTRWLTKKYPIAKVNFALRELFSLGIIRNYPPLPDKGKGMVSQAEHTIIVDDVPYVLTEYRESLDDSRHIGENKQLGQNKDDNIFAFGNIEPDDDLSEDSSEENENSSDLIPGSKRDTDDNDSREYDDNSKGNDDYKCKDNHKGNDNSKEKDDSEEEKEKIETIPSFMGF